MIGSLTVFGQDKDTGYYYNCKTNPDTLDGHPVYKIVSKMPSFPGGDEKLIDYLSEHLTYVKEWRDDTLQTKLFISFVIDSTGTIRNPCIQHSGYSHRYTAFDLEGLKLINQMPKWIPGELDGKKVYVRIYLPIRVDLK
jgi:protein TonB